MEAGLNVTLRRGVLAVLKRLDTVVTAVLVGFAAAPIPSAWLCAEATCRSPIDTFAFYGTTGAVAVVTGAALWHGTRRWWSRSLAFVVASGLTIAVPASVWPHARWSVQADGRRACAVRSGEPRDAVREACGPPSYWCEGPKYIDSSDSWNPLTFTACGFSGDVYDARLVTYDCRGRVASVTGFRSASPEVWRPAGCVQWGRSP